MEAQLKFYKVALHATLPSTVKFKSILIYMANSTHESKALYLIKKSDKFISLHNLYQTTVLWKINNKSRRKVAEKKQLLNTNCLFMRTART